MSLSTEIKALLDQYPDNKEARRAVKVTAKIFENEIMRIIDYHRQRHEAKKAQEQLVRSTSGKGDSLSQLPEPPMILVKVFAHPKFDKHTFIAMSQTDQITLMKDICADLGYDENGRNLKSVLGLLASALGLGKVVHAHN
jgi:hypothetical protein